MKPIYACLFVLAATTLSLADEPTTLPATFPTSRPAMSPFTRPATRPTTRPIAGIRHAMVVSIDGLRPDLLLRANCPNIRGLMNRGAFTMWARTTAVSVTLPSHTSMMTGVSPNRHQVEWNRALPFREPQYPMTPTLFEVAKRHGYTTAVVSGKDKFVIFDRPGALDWRFIPDKGLVQTPEVTDEAIAIIRDHQPDVMLVHLPDVDTIGHLIGWATPKQMKAIEEADRSIGRLLAALDEMNLTDSTLVIVTADHGGAGRTHGPDDARSRHIPWIAAGPGLVRGVDLTIYSKLVVNTEDTFATTCWLLGIPPSVADLDGKPVREIIKPKNAEMLQPVRATKPPASW